MSIVEIFFPIMTAFLIVIAVGPFLIPALRRQKIGQTEREDGVETHLKKAGTPTMGGIMIVIAVLLVSVGFYSTCPKIVPIVQLTIGYGLIGFLDDYLKVVKKRSQGLLPWQKMALQLIVTGGFAFYMYVFASTPMEFLIPFMPGKYLNLGFLQIPGLFFIVIGTVNATNLTDGLDGLLSWVTLFVAMFFMIAAVMLDIKVTPVIGAMIGALMGFLIFNSHPARIFMGDTGSLAIGGFVAGCAYAMQLQLFLLIVGGIYVAETLSVIMQVSYFKLTHGKRIFKMTPIHHHFEKCGVAEEKITSIFTIVTAALAVLSIIALNWTK